MQVPDLDKELLAEAIATAMIHTTDESGDFVGDLWIMVDRLGIRQLVEEQIKALSGE
jgi:hypothetical protein